ncbi:unnamed protein product, partial [Amoebophrya sp. A25]|eukprot:GSA25T00008160001.1
MSDDMELRPDDVAVTVGKEDAKGSPSRQSKGEKDADAPESPGGGAEDGGGGDGKRKSRFSSLTGAIPQVGVPGLGKLAGASG